ncbi:DUF2306 domain-containing protein [Microbacterium sp. HD4P20]|uniref:DUF2306 domain-containing protein n=1 Tax=Microbacterium sp. HD4P20 TaxID=2864874 RepID=UPI001C6403AF|nr:DUF2306 domain-containing protein [Microbacterium sp. HD4P20]MCP2638478.1 DUF2306 domain-containing protein [Microbacterium sp. HD4P20]
MAQTSPEADANAPLTRPHSPARPRRGRRAEWLAPAGLIALSLVPILAGAMRVTSLTVGADVTPENVRFFDSPVPVILHIVGSSVYLVLGALQFAPSLRRRRWHRIAGRILVPAGLISALSGLWMTIFYAIPEAMNGPALIVMRLVFSTAMAAAIVVAVVAIRRGDVSSHSAWMTRAYAIGLAAGTQVFTFLPWTLAFGAPGQAMHSVLMGLGWAINLTVAEIVIRRRARPRSRRAVGRPARGHAPIMRA